MTSIFLNFLNMSISAGWLVLAVLVLRVFLKKVPKWVNPLLWGMVGLRLIVPYSMESVLSLIPSRETIPPEIIYSPEPAIQSGSQVVDQIVNPIITETFAPNPAASVNPLQIWLSVAGVIWLVGIGIMVLYTLFSYLGLKRRIGTAVRLQDNIYQSEAVASPFVLGIIRPRIYLPYQMKEADMLHVIAHEQAHIKRKDHWIKPIGFALLSLYWFHPLLWVAYILFCRDIELACDERVVKELNPQERAAYSEALLSCSISRGKIAACPLAFGEVSVKDRVKNVLHYKKPAFWTLIAASIVCVVVAVCFLTNPKEDAGSGTESESANETESIEETESVEDTEFIEETEAMEETEPIETAESTEEMGSMENTEIPTYPTQDPEEVAARNTPAENAGEALTVSIAYEVAGMNGSIQLRIPAREGWSTDQVNVSYEPVGGMENLMGIRDESGKEIGVVGSRPLYEELIGKEFAEDTPWSMLFAGTDMGKRAFTRSAPGYASFEAGKNLWYEGNVAVLQTEMIQDYEPNTGWTPYTNKAVIIADTDNGWVVYIIIDDNQLTEERFREMAEQLFDLYQ